MYEEDNGASKSPKKLCYVAPRRPWEPSQIDMMQVPTSQFQAYSHPSQSNCNTLCPWKPWPSQPQNQSWKQGWQEPYGRNC